MSDITSSGSVVAAVSATQAVGTGAAAQTLVLKKALDQQTANAASLLKALPPPLASDGSLGTKLNTYA